MLSRRSILAEAAKQIVCGVVLADGGTDLTQLAPKLAAATIATPLIDSVNVQDFGADPTGHLDSNEAIAQALRHCLAVSDPALPKALYFPRGRFLITQSNVLRSSSRLRAIHAWRIFGAGAQTTQLIFRPVGAPSITAHYLYDGFFD